MEKARIQANTSVELAKLQSKVDLITQQEASENIMVVKG
jgi:hypothetical protein